MTANKRKIFREWGRIVGGLIVFGFGVHLTIFANIGLAPWDCFGMGIARHTVLNFGLSMTVMGVVILFIDLAMKERIGFGTIIDALLVGLGKCLPRLSIGVVEIILWGTVTFFGWILGGPIGIGTLYGALGAGVVMNIVYRLIRFEPRDIKHRDVIEVVRELKS